MLSAARSPFDQFFSLKGDPLEAGKIYFGLPDQDPEQYPAQVFWDAEGTIPALQPIRTISGYPARNGAPAQVYVDGLYSIRVRQSNNIQVFYVRSVFGGIIGGASGTQISFNQAGTSIVRSMQNKAREVVSATDFGAIGDGIVDDTASLQSFLNYISNRDGSGYVPVGNYLTTGLVVSGSDKHFKLFGEGSGGSIIINPSTPSPTLLLTHASGTVGPNQITIESLTIAGNSSSRSAFFADDLIHSSFNDVYFQGSRIGFELNGAVDVVLNQCYIGDNSTGVKLWIDVSRPLPNDPCTMVTFRDTHIKDNSALGINIDGLNSAAQYSTNILFDGCNIEGNGQLNTPGNGSAYLSPFTRNVHFTNCWFEGNNGFVSDFCQFSKYDNNYFVLNLGNATYGYNIFKYAGNYVAENNWFVGYPASGFNIGESQPDALVLSGNWLNNNKGSLGAPVFSVDSAKTKYNFDSYFIQTGTNASGTEVTISYQQPFKAAPIVLAQVINSDIGKINECEVYDVTSTDFKIRKKSFDGATIGLLNYTINWTALGQP